MTADSFISLFLATPLSSACIVYFFIYLRVKSYQNSMVVVGGELRRNLLVGWGNRINLTASHGRHNICDLSLMDSSNIRLICCILDDFYRF